MNTTTTTTETRRLPPVARWFLGLSLGQLLRTIAWVAGSLALLAWWATAGVYVASDVLDAALSTPRVRHGLLAYLGAFYITWKLIARPLLRRRRWQAVSVPVRGGVAVPAARSLAGEDARQALERRARHEAAHAVACSWVGGRVLRVDIESAGMRDGLCLTEHAEKRLPDNAWSRLVTQVAGQLVDVEDGAHDYGSSNDMARALESVAAILSTGQCPTGYDGELTTDALFAAARKAAAEAITRHSQVLDDLTAALLANPERPLSGPALDRLLEPVAPATPTSRGESA